MSAQISQEESLNISDCLVFESTSQVALGPGDGNGEGFCPVRTGTVRQFLYITVHASLIVML